MAVAQGTKFVAPSVDSKTVAQLNSTQVEAGLFHCSESVTISALDMFDNEVSVTSNRWTVICISDENAITPKCYTQIWIDSNSVQSVMFIRYLTKDATAFTTFSMIATTEYLREKTVLNTHNEPVHVVVSNTQPTAESGITKIWIDTSGS